MDMHVIDDPVVPFTTRIDKPLLERLRVEARRNRRSIRQELMQLLEEALALRDQRAG